MNDQEQKDQDKQSQKKLKDMIDEVINDVPIITTISLNTENIVMGTFDIIGKPLIKKDKT